MNIETKSIETKYIDSTKRVAALDPSESTCRIAAARIIANGAPINAREVLVEHPEFAQFKSVVLDLAYEEYCQRIDNGESITASQFCEQFPEYQKSLTQQLEIHQLMSKDGDLIFSTIETAFPEVGEDFLGYSINAELGRGAFARVYLASEQALGNRAVAIKVALFGADEAGTLGKLNHPNIVPVYSFSHDDETGLSLMCMPYLGRTTLCDVLDQMKSPGSSLNRKNVISDAILATGCDKLSNDRTGSRRKMLREGPFTESVLRLALQLSEGLAHAHSAGILHMDLKPSNVLITSDRVPMLLDFNLSRDEDNEKRPLGGTIPYMSPEHLQVFSDGNQGTGGVDERSDIFSLGVILYELLSGHLPFGPVPTDVTSKQLADELYARRKTGPEPLRQANASIDERVASIIDRCIAFDPNDRPRTATDLAGQLRSELGIFRRVRRWTASHPVATFSIAAAFSLLLITACFAYATRPPLEVRELQRGASAFQKANFEFALQCLNRSIEREPTVDAHFLRCQTNLALERYELALADLEAAMELAPDDERWSSFGLDQLATAEAAFEEANYESTISHLKLTISINPNSSDAYFLRGQTHAKLSDFDSAASDTRRALKNEEDPQMMAFLGYCYNKKRLHTDAVHWYQVATKNGFESAGLYNNLGFSHLQRGRHASARSILDRALELNDNLQAAMHNRALANFELANRDSVFPEKAIADITRAVKSGNSSGELFRDAAVIYAFASKFDVEWGEAAVEHVCLAIERGADPRELRRAPLLRIAFTDPRLVSRSKSLHPEGVYKATKVVNPISP